MKKKTLPLDYNIIVKDYYPIWGSVETKTIMENSLTCVYLRTYQRNTEKKAIWKYHFFDVLPLINLILFHILLFYIQVSNLYAFNGFTLYLRFFFFIFFMCFSSRSSIHVYLCWGCYWIRIDIIRAFSKCVIFTWKLSIKHVVVTDTLVLTQIFSHGSFKIFLAMIKYHLGKYFLIFCSYL